MQFVRTNDSSVTMWSDEYQEYYHSITGAIEEAQKKFVEPSGLKDGDAVLDICFGLGYNSFMAITHARGLKIVALEKDPEVLKIIQMISIDETYEKVIKSLARERSYSGDGYDLRIIFGKAEEMIATVTGQFDVVFLDPFSPKKNPELWEKAFLRSVYQRMKPQARLVTYSCARLVRENLRSVGFTIMDGPKVGRRGPSTIALK